MLPVGIPTIFHKPQTVPLHSPNRRQMTAVRAVCKETVKESTLYNNGPNGYTTVSPSQYLYWTMWDTNYNLPVSAPVFCSYKCHQYWCYVVIVVQYFYHTSVPGTCDMIRLLKNMQVNIVFQQIEQFFVISFISLWYQYSCKCLLRPQVTTRAQHLFRIYNNLIWRYPIYLTPPTRST